MRIKLLVTIIVCMFVLSAFIAYEAVQAQMKPAANRAGDATTNSRQQIEALVHNFLSGVDTVAAHERFWADDLIYTGSTGHSSHQNRDSQERSRRGSQS